MRSWRFGMPSLLKFREKLLADWERARADASEPHPVADAGPIVHQMRLVKDGAELELMRRAVTL